MFDQTVVKLVNPLQIWKKLAKLLQIWLYRALQITSAYFSPACDGPVWG